MPDDVEGNGYESIGPGGLGQSPREHSDPEGMARAARRAVRELAAVLAPMALTRHGLSPRKQSGSGAEIHPTTNRRRSGAPLLGSRRAALERMGVMTHSAQAAGKDGIYSPLRGTRRRRKERKSSDPGNKMAPPTSASASPSNGASP